jgi:hypothetical protein
MRKRPSPKPNVPPTWVPTDEAIRALAQLLRNAARRRRQQGRKAARRRTGESDDNGK